MTCGVQAQSSGIFINERSLDFNFLFLCRYSAVTGIFTADTAGLYYFEQYWLQNANAIHFIDMQKNGVVQCRSRGDSKGTGDYNAPSCSAVLELISGDQVYITSSHATNVACDACSGFTGFLIKVYV